MLDRDSLRNKLADLTQGLTNLNTQVIFQQGAIRIVQDLLAEIDKPEESAEAKENEPVEFKKKK